MTGKPLPQERVQEAVAALDARCVGLRALADQFDAVALLTLPTIDEHAFALSQHIIALTEALRAVRRNAIRATQENPPMITSVMDAVNGPTFVIYGTTMNKVAAALKGQADG